jgi:hypothetical protein
VATSIKALWRGLGLALVYPAITLKRAGKASASGSRVPYRNEDLRSHIVGWLLEPPPMRIFYMTSAKWAR